MEFKAITNGIIDFGEAHKSFWGNALAGEVGEACNLIKKDERDGIDITEPLAEELADVFIYTALIARRYSIDLESAILKKIIEVKARKKRGEKV